MSGHVSKSPILIIIHVAAPGSISLVVVVVVVVVWECMCSLCVCDLVFDIYREVVLVQDSRRSSLVPILPLSMATVRTRKQQVSLTPPHDLETPPLLPPPRPLAPPSLPPRFLAPLRHGSPSETRALSSSIRRSWM